MCAWVCRNVCLCVPLCVRVGQVLCKCECLVNLLLSERFICTCVHKCQCKWYAVCVLCTRVIQCESSVMCV